MADTALISTEEFSDLYNEAYYAWDALYPESETDMRFYLGDQWSEQEKSNLFEQGRSAYVFNRVRSGINLITGYQRQNRLSTVVSPVKDGDQKTADQRSQCVLHSFQSDNAYNTISDAFQGSCITGFNLISLWKDFSQDPIDGDIKYTREPWNSFIVDPYFTKRDFSDCNYIIRRKYVSADQAEMLLPKEKGFIEDVAMREWERDDKFTWIPYQRQPSLKLNLLAYDEVYRRETVMQNVILDTETNRMMDFDGEMRQFKLLREEYPQLEMIKRPKNRIRLDILINNHPVNVVYNQYGLDEYPFVPSIAIFMPESDQWDLKIQSLVRQLRDPQRESNKRRSQMSDILESQINSGYVAEEDSVINPKSLFQSGQGNVIWKKRGVMSPEKIQPAQVPPSMFQLQELYDRDIMEILGVNDAAFGRSEHAGESGVMQQLRQSAAITNIQDVFDNLRLCQKLVGAKTMKMQMDWSPEKIEKIIGEKPTEQFFDKDSTKYDVVVQEGVLTDTQRAMYFRQLVDLQQLGVQLPPMALAKAAPIQGKTELYEEMEQFQQQQQQEAAKQTEKEQALMQAQMDLAKSKSIEQMAGAKERFTRATANLGLLEERNSEAIQNRNQATLDEVRAMKELEQMDLTTIEKTLAITEMLSQRNKMEEEESKSHDVAIADMSSQIELPSQQQAQQQGGNR